MNKQSKRILGLFSRYFALLLAGAGNLYIFYKILTPLTIRTTGGILSLFGATRIAGSFILFKETIIEIAPACVAGAAFYLLFLFILSTAEVKPLKRFYALVMASAMFFILNLSRIIFLALIAGASYFPTVHWIFWNLVSTVFVVAVWFAIVKIYKMKSIPVYSDMVYLRSLMKSGKKSKRQKKN